MNTVVRQRLDSHPHELPEAEYMARAIEACFDCAQACTLCADACLSEDPSTLVACIRLNQDCADICQTAGRVLSRQNEPDRRVLRAVLELTSKVASECGTECQRHAGEHEHCRLCAQACHHTQQACDELMGRTTWAT